MTQISSTMMFTPKDMLQFDEHAIGWWLRRIREGLDREYGQKVPDELVRLRFEYEIDFNAYSICMTARVE